MTNSLLNASALIVVGLASCLPLAAAETDWQDNLGGRARAIAAGPIDPQTLSVDLAVQLELKKGWKTYWRSPGDSGIPPDFDFSGSANLKDYEILWPAPKSFSDAYGSSIGYKDVVILPIRAVARSGALPLVVAVTMRYGVCERICVPVENAFSLVVTRTSAETPALAALIEGAHGSVPAHGDPDAPLAVVGVARQGEAPNDHLLVTTRIAAPNDHTELFIEGPKDWYFPLPKKVSETGGMVDWSVALAGLPDGAEISGKDFTFTLVSGKHAVEQNWHLD